MRELGQSRWLAKEDFPQARILTCKEITEETVGQPPEELYVLWFEGLDQGLVLNATNEKLLRRAAGTGHPEQIPGKQVQVFNDPEVYFGGKKVGGLRIAKVEDDIPF